jgi:hypothetical protein
MLFAILSAIANVAAIIAQVVCFIIRPNRRERERAEYLQWLKDSHSNPDLPFPKHLEKRFVFEEYRERKKK